MHSERGIILEPNLALYLPLHELDGSSFMSKDAYGHLCTVTGALWGPNGRYFDGIDDSIAVPHASSLAITGAITIEYYLKPGKTATQSVIQKADPVYAGYSKGGYYTQLTGSNKVEFSFTNGLAGGNDGNWDSVASLTAITSGLLFHVATVWDGTTDADSMKVYINGVLDNTATATKSSIKVWTGSMRIGRYLSGGGAWSREYKGLIGEVHIYSRALNPLEIQRNYLATKWRYQ